MSDHREPNLAERLERLRDPNGPTFVSPLGDRRERPVPCSRCRRPTPALRAVCVSCLEVELLAGRDLCGHVGEERVRRVAHGYLGDRPAGTVEILCGGCGAELELEGSER